MDASRPVLWPKFTRFRGDTKRLRFTLTDDLGAVLRPSEHTLLFSVVDGAGALLVQKASTVGGFTVIDDPAGVVEVELVPADDAALTVGVAYDCDVQAQHTATHAIHTVKGSLRLVADATPGTTLDLPTTTTNPSAGYTWTSLTGKPTTLAGFGIDDALTSTATLAADATVAANATAAANAARDTAIAASQRRATADVRDYGALGDGTTDDTAAIQAALSSAHARIYVPPGTYRITSYLRIPSNKCLTLASAATMLRTGTSNAMLINDADGVTSNYAANTNIVVEGGTWDGQSDLYPSPCTLIAFGHASDVMVRDAVLKNVPAWHGLELNGSRRATVERVRFVNVASSECLQLDTPFNAGTFPWFGPFDNVICRDITVRDCQFESGFAGLGSHSYPPVDNLLVAGCVFSTTYGFKPLGYTNVVVEHNRFVGCSYVWQGAADRFICRDNRVSGTTAADFDFTGCTNGLVTNNVITGVRTGFANLAPTVIERDNLVDGVLTTTDARTALPFTAETLAKHAFFHDGTAAKITIASAPATGTHDFHFSGWYYPFELRDNTFLFGRDEGGTAIGIRISGTGVTVLRAVATADVVTTAAGAIVANQWSFIEAWRTGGTSYVAVNGVTLASQPDAYSYLPCTSLSTNVATPVHGLVARAKFLNFVPTVAERTRLYQQLGVLPRDWRGGTMTAVAAGAFVIGTRYTVANVGTTAFTTIGAATNTVGAVFTATGIGSGTGLAYPAGALWAIDDAEVAPAGQPAADLSGGGHTFTLPASGVWPVMSAPDNPAFTTARIGAGSLTSGLMQVGSVATGFLRLPLQVGGGAAIDATGFAPSLYGRRYNGALTSPTAVTNGQGLLAIQAGGHNGATVVDNPAAIVLSAAENWSPTAQGTSMSFQTTSKGYTANLARVAVLDHGALQTGLNSAANGTPAWGTSGIVTRSTPGTTHTDTTSSGTAATAVAHSLATTTFAASNATTYTDAANLHIAGDPIAGNGATFTNSWGLWNAGKTRLDGRVNISASTTGRAGLNLAPGTAPTAPTDGDVWTTSTGVYAQIGGTTVGPFATAAGSAQPLDADLSAIAALTTTTFGRNLLTLADAASGRSALGLGTLATQSGTFNGSVNGTFTGTSSGTNTGDQTSVTGNAGTATALATARAINGVSFNGTADITVPAAANTLTGTTLASGVTVSTLTSAAGGTFGSAAFTAASAYATAAQGTKADNAGAITGLLKSNGSAAFAPAVAGTDYLTPNGSGAALSGIPTSVAGRTGTVTLAQADIAGLTTADSPIFTGLIENVASISVPAYIQFKTAGVSKWIFGRGVLYSDDDMVWYSGLVGYQPSMRLTPRGSLTVTGDINIWDQSGGGGGTGGLKIYNGGTGYIYLRTRPLNSNNVTLYLPTSDGASGQALTTDGAGQLAFSNIALANGGTGATTAAGARANLGAVATPAWSTVSGTTPALVFSDVEQNVELTLSGNTTFSGSGYAQGRSLNLFVAGGASSYTVSFPGFTWVGGAPATLATGKLLRVCLESRGATATGVCATYAVES
ncbi:MAG: glycosyl hydrolase family 28-related protein [Verrucomicrobia bacterium]|nr:glycosyl hydrolase family 28-related protein [Verrucomicrobiota bacterium]